jgi:phosphohistidine swiveling domain-containing protein
MADVLVVPLTTIDMAALPLVCVKDATRLLRDGEMIEVDGATGEVRRLGAVTSDPSTRSGR